MADTSTEPKYTVFIKVPFPRGAFVDPPAANWNSSKEAELWSMLNSTPKNSGINWEQLAQHFDVSLSFLLQQGAWLYERQLLHVREHLSFKHTKQPSGSIPTPPLGGQTMRRAGSGQGPGSRAPSSLSIRPKMSSELKRDTTLNEPTTPPLQKTRAPYSRTTSATTITQLQRSPSLNLSPRQRKLSTEQAPSSPLSNAGMRRSPDDSDDSSSTDSEPTVAQSRLYARRPRFPLTQGKGKATLQALSSADENSEDDDETPNFLPFSTLEDAKDGPGDLAKGKINAAIDSSSSLRTFKGKTVAERPDLLNSRRPLSASSSDTLSSPNQTSSSIHSLSSPNNPRSPSDGSRVLSALSPRQRKIAQEGSEGTPSMGSSFSDLDDASISRSAMEEALAREIKAGKGSLGVASRLGGLWRQNGAGGSGSGPGSGRGKGVGH